MWVPEGILGATEGGEGRLLGLRRLAGGEPSHPLRPRFQARDAAARGVFPPFRSAVLLTHSGGLRSTRLPVWGERCRGSSVRLSPRTPCAVAAAPLCLDCSLSFPSRNSSAWSPSGARAPVSSGHFHLGGMTHALARAQRSGRFALLLRAAAGSLGDGSRVTSLGDHLATFVLCKPPPAEADLADVLFPVSFFHGPFNT